MDIALCFDRLVPGGDWQGSVTANTRESFEMVRWNDQRKKPSWSEMLSKWGEIKAEPEPVERDLLAELDNLKERIEKLETKKER